jgi:acetyl esterase/lipase
MTGVRGRRGRFGGGRGLVRGTRRRRRWRRALEELASTRDLRHMGPWFLVAATTGLWFTRQATRPVHLPKRRAIPSFFAGWLANELVPHHYFWQSAATVIFVRKGALEARSGRIALGVVGLQWLMMLRLLRDALRAGTVMEQTLVDALGRDYRQQLPESAESWDELRVRGLAVPFYSSHPAVRRERNLTYARVGAHELKVDVFAPKAPGRRRPAVIYVHGGAWTLGFRDRQGGPLLTEMAARGWVGFLPGYRLSPVATYPDHLVDVKRAIAWIRAHADEYGVDPDHIAIAGGSAGGHLAAMAALTAGDPFLQPGFEDADTSVQACVPFYGVYDAGEHVEGHVDDFERFLARFVVKADFDEDPEAWDRFRPMANLTADAPPFLVIHGDQDTLTSPGEARRFAERLREVSRSPVGYAELPGCQHAFDVFPSVRTGHVLRGVARFLAVTEERSRRFHQQRDEAPRPGAMS